MKKISSLESLRGIAALSLVIFHFDIGSSFNYFTKNAWLMVDFFFVLSGFVMNLTYCERLNTPKDFFVFMKKRFLRLYPLHVLVLTLFVALELLKLFSIKFLSFDAVNKPFTGFKTISSLVPNMLLMQNIFVKTPTWNTASWSISAEFFVYIIFASTMVLLHKKTKMRLILFLFFILTAHWILQLKGMWTSNITGPSRCIYSFFLGYYTFLLFKINPQKKYTYLGLITLLLSIGAVIKEDCLPRSVVVFIPVLFAISIYFIVCSKDESLFIKLLTLKPLVFLGTISYGIYMFHLLIIHIVGITARMFFHFPLKENGYGGMTLDFNSTLAPNLLMLTVVITTIICATLSYKYFETYFYKKK